MKLTLKQIDDLLKQKDIDPAFKESLKKKKEILSNDKTIRKDDNT